MNDQTLCLPARIHGERAVHFFDAPRLANLYGLLVKPSRVAQRGGDEPRVLPFVERIWMPAYAILLRATLRGTESAIWTTVDAWSGEMSMFEGRDDLTPCQKTEDFFDPKLTEEQAVQAARLGILRIVLRRRGQRKPTVEAADQVVLYYYPFWIHYYQRSKGVDIRVLDAVSGQPAGAKGKMSVINALIEASKKPETS